MTDYEGFVIAPELLALAKQIEGSKWLASIPAAEALGLTPGLMTTMQEAARVFEGSVNPSLFKQVRQTMEMALPRDLWRAVTDVVGLLPESGLSFEALAKSPVVLKADLAAVLGEDLW